MIDKTFDPNDPSLWKEFNPHEKVEEFVGNKSEANINKARSNVIKNTNSNFIEKRTRSQNTPEYKQARSKLSKKYMDENYDDWKQKHLESMQDEKLRARIGNMSKERFANPEYRNNAKKRMKKVFADNPEIGDKIRQKALGRTASAKTKKLMSQVRTGKKHAATTRQKMTRVFIGTNIETGKKIICHGTTGILAAGFSTSMVSECVNGKRESTKGYTWKKLNPNDKA
jgi:hypothetical protein